MVIVWWVRLHLQHQKRNPILTIHADCKFTTVNFNQNEVGTFGGNFNRNKMGTFGGTYVAPLILPV